MYSCYCVLSWDQCSDKTLFLSKELGYFCTSVFTMGGWAIFFLQLKVSDHLWRTRNCSECMKDFFKGYV